MLKRRIFRVLFTLMLVLSLSLVMAAPVSAAATVTPASGGTTISADDTGGAWTSLGNIIISEGASGDIAVGTFVLTIPSGFEFNTGSAPDVAATGTTPELAANTPAAITSTTITVTVTTASTTEADNDLTIGGVTPIQVRPTAGTPLASGNITMTSGTIAGVTGTTNFGTLTEINGTPTKYVIIDPTDGTVDAAIPVTVQRQDQFGNVDTTSAGKDTDVQLDADGSATGDGVDVPITNGTGSLNISDTVAETVNLSLTDSQVTGLDVSSTQDVIFAAGAVAKFTLNAPADITVGGRAGYAVTRRDASDNLVTTGDQTVYLYTDSTGADAVFYDAATGGNVITSVTIAGGSSVENFWYYDRKAGSWTITVSDATPDADGATGIDDATDGLSVTRTGGGGGGIPTAPRDIDTSLFGSVSTFEISAGGEVQETITATSAEGDLTLTIPEDTVALDKDKNPLSTLEVDVDVTPPAPPEGDNIIGLPYDFGPSGATFRPAITVEFTYDPAEVPAGSDLVLAYYDEMMGMWRELPTTVDPVTYTLTASVSHFTTFAIIARMPEEAPPEEVPPPVEEAPPEEAPPVEAPPEEAPPPAAPPPAAAPPGVNWAVAGPIIGVAVFLAIFLPIRRRRRAK